MYIQGNPGLVFLGYEISRDSQNGEQIFKVYEGPFAACRAAALAESKRNGTWDHDAMGPTNRLRIRVKSTEAGSPPDIVREEKLHHNRIAKSLYDHPALAGLDREQKRAIKDMADGTAEVDDEAIQLMSAGAQAIVDLIIKQIDHMTINQPTVTTTQSANLNVSWPLSFSNVERCFTTAAMIVDAGLISNWAGNLPQDSPNPDGYMYGWVKAAPEITTTAYDRSQLVQEYEYGLWSTVLYPPAS